MLILRGSWRASKDLHVLSDANSAICLFFLLNLELDDDTTLVVLIAGGFIDTDPESDYFGNFTVSAENLNFFDVDAGVRQKLANIQTLAEGDVNAGNCVKVLEQIFTACDPDQVECTDPNTESFQVSTDAVCDAVNTPTKLLFEAIGEEFDGFVDADYGASRKFNYLDIVIFQNIGWSNALFVCLNLLFTKPHVSHCRMMFVRIL